MFDDAHLVIANIASPGSARNIASNPDVCVSFIDVFVQKGYKVVGTAQIVSRSDPAFVSWAEGLDAMAGPRFSIRSVFVVHATHVEPIVAPSYRLHPAETSEESQVEAALRTYGVARMPGGDV